jgi:hypothetical protein
MSVYVDPIMPWPEGPKWPWGEVSHLFADSEPELHAFAARLSLKRSWFQHSAGGPNHTGLPHYDLTRAKHYQAIRAGAIVLDRRQAIGFCRAKGWRPAAPNGLPFDDRR